MREGIISKLRPESAGEGIREEPMGKLQGTNPNHPEKGSRITVESIIDEKHIKRARRCLKDNPRDLLLFTIGINNGLRISDLLKLKVGDVKDL